MQFFKILHLSIKHLITLNLKEVLMKLFMVDQTQVVELKIGAYTTI